MPSNTVELTKQATENFVQEIGNIGEEKSLTFIDSIYKLIEGNETLKSFLDSIINIFNKIKEVVEALSGILG